MERFGLGITVSEHAQHRGPERPHSPLRRMSRDDSRRSQDKRAVPVEGRGSQMRRKVAARRVQMARTPSRRTRRAEGVRIPIPMIELEREGARGSASSDGGSKDQPIWTSSAAAPRRSWEGVAPHDLCRLRVRGTGGRLISVPLRGTQSLCEVSGHVRRAKAERLKHFQCDGVLGISPEPRLHLRSSFTRTQRRQRDHSPGLRRS